MVTINVQSKSGEKEEVKKILLDGVVEEKRRIKFALDSALIVMKKYEVKYGFSTSTFIERFKKGAIEENNETFEWWAEAKLAHELKEKLKTVSDIEICR